MEIGKELLVETMNGMENNEVRILLLCYRYSMTIREISKVMGKDESIIWEWRDCAKKRILKETQCQNFAMIKKVLKHMELDELKFFKLGMLQKNMDSF